MEAETHLPSTFKELMNNDDQIHAFSSWTDKVYEDNLGDALVVEEKSIYDKQRAAFVKTLGEKDFAMKAALSEYIRHEDKENFWMKFDIDKVTWKDVEDELQKVETIYQDQGVGNPLRRVFRRGAAYSNTAASLLEAIPNDDGLGLLKGALLVVLKLEVLAEIERRLQATEKRSQVRERIFQCFREVPDIVYESKQAQKSFPGKRNLFRLTYALYQAIFDCIPSLVQILLRDRGTDWYKRAGKAVMSALVDQVAEVESVLQQLTEAQRSLQQAYSTLVEERSANDSRLANATQNGIGVIRRNQLQHHHETSFEINSLASKVDTVASAVDLIKEQVQRMESKSMASVQEHPLINHLYMLLEGALRDKHIYNARQQDLTRGLLSGSDWEEHVLNIGDVLATLLTGGEAVSHSQDLSNTLTKHHYFGDEALAQPAYLINVERFRQWLVESRSDILLVDAHVGSEMSGSISPMSVFCATLVQSLLERSRLTHESGRAEVVLFFFCGLHRSRQSDLEGPSGLIRSLLGQLLLSWPKEWPLYNDSMPSLLEIKAGNTEAAVPVMARMFQELVSTLPLGTIIYCVVDDISAFDTELWGRLRGLEVIIDCLRKLVGPPGTRHKNEAYVKVVMTSANCSSKAVRDMLAGEQNISLRAGQYLSQPVSPMSPASLDDQLQRARSLTDATVQEDDHSEPLYRPAHPRGRPSSEF